MLYWDCFVFMTDPNDSDNLTNPKSYCKHMTAAHMSARFVNESRAVKRTRKTQKWDTMIDGARGV